VPIFAAIHDIILFFLAEMENSTYRESFYGDATRRQPSATQFPHKWSRSYCRTCPVTATASLEFKSCRTRNNILGQSLSKAQKGLKLKFTLQKATKAQRGSRVIALLFV
jgi:hypothetical protein